MGEKEESRNKEEKNRIKTKEKTDKGLRRSSEKKKREWQLALSHLHTSSQHRVTWRLRRGDRARCSPSLRIRRPALRCAARVNSLQQTQSLSASEQPEYWRGRRSTLPASSAHPPVHTLAVKHPKNAPHIASLARTGSRRQSPARTPLRTQGPTTGNARPVPQAPHGTSCTA